MDEILDLTIKELHHELIHKKISATEIADFYLDRINTHVTELNAFITVTADRAKADAQKVDQSIAKGDSLSSLAGIPASIKDIIVTKGIRSTGGSQILKNYFPPFNATLVNILEREGMILVGKTNCDEFAMGGSNENSSFGPVKNPWDYSKVSGGSSGGSAASVAAGLSHYAIGTDTGGSVREPASFCSVVGFKPTYGRISRRGIMAMGSSLDQAGVIARRIEDVREVFTYIEGEDPCDTTTSRAELSIPSTNDSSLSSLQGIRVGVPTEFFAEGLDPEVNTIIKDSINELEKLGAEIIDISLPHARYALATYYIVMPAEVSSNMGKYDGIRYGLSQISGSDGIKNLQELYEFNRSLFLGPEVKRRIMLGTYVLSAGYYDQYYGKAQRVRRLITQDFKNAFEQVDLIVGPVAPTPAFGLGEKTNDPLSMYLADIYTVTVNLAALPALSVPAGFTKSPRLPVGLHLIGKWWDDYWLLAVAELFEQATKWYAHKPLLSNPRI